MGMHGDWDGASDGFIMSWNLNEIRFWFLVLVLDLVWVSVVAILDLVLVFVYGFGFALGWFPFLSSVACSRARLIRASRDMEDCHRPASRPIRQHRRGGDRSGAIARRRIALATKHHQEH
jgi:hypothetical protein